MRLRFGHQLFNCYTGTDSESAVLTENAWLYAMIGIVGLLAVTIFGSTSYGAKISVTIGGLFSIQPSEFVKFYLYFCGRHAL